MRERERQKEGERKEMKEEEGEGKKERKEERGKKIERHALPEIPLALPMRNELLPCHTHTAP